MLKGCVMKSAKTVLLMLACVWTALLLIEKIFNTASSIKVRNVWLPRKVIYHAFRLFKSALLISLVIANVFMAIALIEDKK